MFHIQNRNGVPTLFHNEKRITETSDAMMTDIDAKFGLNYLLDEYSRDFDVNNASLALGMILEGSGMSEINENLPIDGKQYVLIAKRDTSYSVLKKEGEDVLNSTSENLKKGKTIIGFCSFALPIKDGIGEKTIVESTTKEFIEIVKDDFYAIT